MYIQFRPRLGGIGVRSESPLTDTNLVIAIDQRTKLSPLEERLDGRTRHLVLPCPPKKNCGSSNSGNRASVNP